MTREEFWEIVKKLVRKDYWDAQSVPSKEIKEILTKSILIPKPKFRVGDVVQYKESKYLITEVLYNYRQEMWQYYNSEYGISWRMNEDELEIVEEGK